MACDLDLQNKTTSLQHDINPCYDVHFLSPIHAKQNGNAYSHAENNIQVVNLHTANQLLMLPLSRELNKWPQKSGETLSDTFQK